MRRIGLLFLTLFLTLIAFAPWGARAGNLVPVWVVVGIESDGDTSTYTRWADIMILNQRAAGSCPYEVEFRSESGSTVCTLEASIEGHRTKNFCSRESPAFVCHEVCDPPAAFRGYAVIKTSPSYICSKATLPNAKNLTVWRESLDGPRALDGTALKIYRYGASPVGD